uniref:Uncharacterized protein n=1 Tax=Haptolina ericina TaxID=156174 RepID=A0A7S3BMF9_9EUKA|mmetsp:Transcript_63477/g.141558  ORF Transcript_63477/g.141558 Transcript_63477/m.141558 type:complete len:199 (+) Transcript_63477:243-839(+)
MLLSMFRHLQGTLLPTGKVLGTGTRNEKGAARYTLGKKLGRPSREVAAAEAAARLVGSKWRQYKQQQAKKQRDKPTHAAARAARPTVGRFTSRGNAITGVKAAAIVQTSQFAAFINRTNCSCGERLSFHEKGSSQVGAAAHWAVRCAGGCAPIALDTSAPLFGDDYEVNYSLQLSAVVCMHLLGDATAQAARAMLDLS